MEVRVGNKTYLLEQLPHLIRLSLELVNIAVSKNERRLTKLKVTYPVFGPRFWEWCEMERIRRRLLLTLTGSVCVHSTFAVMQ